MMRVGINDKGAVMRVMGHDSVFKAINGFPCNDPDYMDGLLRSPNYILMPNENSVFVFLIYNRYMYNGHSAILPEGRGRDGFRAGRAACSWIFENTGCEKIYGLTPAHKKHIIKYNLVVGFKEEGLLSGCRDDDGTPCDMVLFGRSKWE